LVNNGTMIKEELKLHLMVKTHKCYECGQEFRILKHIGKFIKPCNYCGSSLYPLDVLSQHKAWEDE